MSAGPVLIKRYPNRRFYARNTRSYVSLQEIEEMVQAGITVEIRDSQTDDDLTRTVLTQIIIERHPEKMLLFPTDLLHFILRSNDVMSGFLRDYFQHSSAYLDYLKRHSTATATMVQPMHWVKAWLDSLTKSSRDDPQGAPPSSPEPLSERVEQLEQRLKELESKKTQ